MICENAGYCSTRVNVKNTTPTMILRSAVITCNLILLNFDNTVNLPRKGIKNPFVLHKLIDDSETSGFTFKHVYMENTTPSTISRQLWTGVCAFSVCGNIVLRILFAIKRTPVDGVHVACTMRELALFHLYTQQASDLHLPPTTTTTRSSALPPFA